MANCNTGYCALPACRAEFSSNQFGGRGQSLAYVPEDTSYLQMLLVKVLNILKVIGISYVWESCGWCSQSNAL